MGVAIGSPVEAIEVVAGEADADAEAVDEGFDLLGFSVVVGVHADTNHGSFYPRSGTRKVG